MNSTPYGRLYVVATPIGNLDDMTLRAIETLKKVHCIYAEDTRQTSKLLQHFNIQNRVYQLHKHNESQQKHRLEQQLRAGEDIAIVSDAGTPLISDPGANTIAYLRDLHHEIRVIPGCSAVTSALSISGLTADYFSFIGFLPTKSNQRKAIFKQFANTQHTVVFFETPHRIIDCLADAMDVLGTDRMLFIARELTKQFEESILCPLSEAQHWIQENPYRCKGEFVLALSPCAKPPINNDWQPLADLMLDQDIPNKSIHQVITQFYNAPKKTVYNYLLNPHEKTE